MSRRRPSMAWWVAAAFAVAPLAQAQMPVPVNAGVNQGELLYQLQLLQQEVMQLRGLVEQQGHELRQLKQQSLDRYVDLDRRFAELGAGGVSTAATATATATTLSGDSEVDGATLTTSTALSTADELEQYKAAFALVKAGQFAEAHDAFARFLERYPEGRYAANAWFWRGEMYMNVSPKNLEQARFHYQQVVDRFAGSSKRVDATFKLAKVYFELGDTSRARSLLEGLVQKEDATLPTVRRAKDVLTGNFALWQSS